MGMGDSGAVGKRKETNQLVTKNRFATGPILCTYLVVSRAALSPATHVQPTQAPQTAVFARQHLGPLRLSPPPSSPNDLGPLTSTCRCPWWGAVEAANSATDQSPWGHEHSDARYTYGWVTSNP